MTARPVPNGGLGGGRGREVVSEAGGVVEEQGGSDGGGKAPEAAETRRTRHLHQLQSQSGSFPSIRERLKPLDANFWSQQTKNGGMQENIFGKS